MAANTTFIAVNHVLSNGRHQQDRSIETGTPACPNFSIADFKGYSISHLLTNGTERKKHA
jgi:hypothetical protein